MRITRMTKSKSCKANLITKLEFFNPLTSVKNQIKNAIISTTKAKNKISPNSVIIKPTSNNTSITLAFICAAHNYHYILIMPDSISQKHHKILKLLKTELILTPTTKHMPNSIAKAQEIINSTKNTIILQQFQNPANPEVHRHTTAKEI